MSESTINRYLAVTSHLLNRALEWGWLDKLPVRIRKYRETQQRIHYLTQPEIKRLLATAKQDNHPFIHLFIIIGLETAMRKMEILSIRLKDIDLDRNSLYVPDAKAGARIQPLSDHLVSFLREYLPSQTQTNQEWLFPSKLSKCGHMVEIRKPFMKVVKNAGLDTEKVVRHTLRHTAITHLVQAGVDLPTVKRISGHKTLIMVERYAHQNTEHIQNALGKLQQRYQR